MELMRDKDNNALLNTDSQALVAYKAARAKAKKIDDMGNEINTIKEQLEQIKELVLKLITEKV